MARPLANSAGYRRYDRQLLTKGAKLGFRYKEPAEAECYFCDRRHVTDSREHIIPRWLQQQLAIQNETFHPAYYRGTKLQTDRGPIPAKNLVSRGICTECNNGWMSAVEARFKAFVTGTRREVPLEDVVRWFVKTAYVLNVSQNTRLMVPRQERVQFAKGSSTTRVGVYFHRLTGKQPGGGRFCWIQNAGLPPLLDVPIEREDQFWYSIKRVWCCAIRIDDVCGTVVVNPPEDVYRVSWEAEGSIACEEGELADKIYWSSLPRVPNFKNCVFVMPHRVQWADDTTHVRSMMGEFPSGVNGPLEVNQGLREWVERIKCDSRFGGLTIREDHIAGHEEL